MNPGIAYALLGAALFGASTPIAKLLVGEIGPVMLAGLLYAGSGVGLGLWLAVRGLLWRAAERLRFAPGDYKWLAGAVVSVALFQGGWLWLRHLPGFSMVRFPYVWIFMTPSGLTETSATPAT